MDHSFEIETIHKNYNTGKMSYKEALTLLRRTNQQSLILSWGEISGIEALHYFCDEINPMVFLVNKKQKKPKLTIQEKDTLKGIGALYNLRKKNNYPKEEVFKALEEIESCQDIYSGTLKEQALKKNYHQLKQLVDFYAYVPELFWSFLPQTRKGLFRKQSIICLWSSRIAQKSFWGKSVPFNIGIYLKMQEPHPRLFLGERTPKITTYHGFYFLSYLPCQKENSKLK